MRYSLCESTPGENTMPDTPQNPEKPESEPITRQAFLKQGMGMLMSQVANTLPSFSLPETSSKVVVLRPPGALSGEAFSSTCEPFCNECRDVCPRNSIFQDRLGLPYIDPTVAPCVMCVDVPCTKVCPTEALTPLLTPGEIDMGTAVIELTVCTAYQGSGCKVCYDTCPIPNTAIQITEGLPEIVPEGCTGCGVCVFSCPTPEAIAIRPKSA
jgi:ferredoxin-type protein NapG